MKEEHSNKYYDQQHTLADHISGIVPSVRSKIVDIIKINPLIKPMTIWSNLDRDLTIPKEYLPNHKQIQRLKSKLLSKDGEGDEIGRVDTLIKEHSYQANIDPNKAFIFASRNGSGSDVDPFAICITALNWLTWLNEYV